MFSFLRPSCLSVSSSAGPAPDGAPPIPAHPGQGGPEWERHRPEGLALRSPAVLQSIQWYEGNTVVVDVQCT